MTTTRDHVTAFFIAGIFYWLMGDEQTASFCWQEGEWVLLNASFVGDV